MFSPRKPFPWVSEETGHCPRASLLLTDQVFTVYMSHKMLPVKKNFPFFSRNLKSPIILGIFRLDRSSRLSYLSRFREEKSLDSAELPLT
jgi:hypothetical protein